MQVGDLVRVTANGVSVLRIVEIDGATAIVEAADLPEDAPGRYPYPLPLAYLVPAEGSGDSPADSSPEPGQSS
ncbi:hypothetical protein IU436_28370 [Nocardia farcinica]|uniref:hypothetical protein n=1 Tax=Nocardia farcinica TaxID=37329 RepID=UPI001893AD67|nr:hypothetical protein [Nocardia farcinica]MBF6422591.1 hypothetical protein [Nocardia farcinica]MBF6434253.1 hypothetical protein [Nocardia farcinica]MBF6505337.1 hypothetical protein [Nocardia farcinica]MBF6574117.1 hypothetical protein [Nocardia farcinica]